ncbi:hypothetical protein LAZ67_1004907 [Cordylochernes scorpioides]|uniref:RNA-directed DNA polymerase n=1 Tax=Cordylochernes scorpioides TaxID=51811 RepID=A0ABY6K0Q3_9ARAC|nr:hypothetical protein LAZ67_1004907 [Cordylochernes scorpioides]
MLQLPLKRLRFNQSSPFKSNNKKPRNDIATDRLSRQDSEMELNQDPTGVKSDDPTETMERRQEVRESESARERQEVIGRETTAPLADAVNQLSTLLTRAKISDGAESAIPPFDGTYSATQFFQTFDRKMEDASMGEQEKLLRLPNYLVRQPLELFRKLRLADRSYFQVRQILLDLYPESSEASFAKYFAMKLTGQANLETYYREKTAMGLQLGLPQEVILETLTEGLPFNDQRLVRVVPPENLGEWFRLVQRIHGPSVPATRSREDQPPTMSGLYQPTRLPFGLKTSPQIYERAISQVLQRHGLDCVAHYFDDFIIYSNTLEEHQNHLRQFFAFCEAEKLQLNFAKCEFFKQSINFLGYTITAGTITPLTRNTDIIHAIKQPHNRKTLQSFLGAVNVYNKFIPEYARLRAPLNNLLKKDVVWNWNEACQEAFIDLKGNLTQHPILHLYKEGLPCQVYCDASTLGIAGILKQVHPDGNVYPVQYFSRTLRPHEKNYSISELECLAIVESVEKFRIYLMGRKFTIFSDHHALQWLKTIKNPSGRLFRWSLRLSSYEYEVRYIKGKLQYEADLLSRNPFCGFLDATLIKTHQSPPSKESSLTIDHNGLHTVSRKGVTKIILPKPLIQQLLQTVHTQYNHPGISQMSRIISTQYYWQGMSKDIKQKVKTCPTCQLTKRPVGPTYGELSQPPESKEPFDLLSLDTIAGFAKYGNTKVYLHVVVDHFSRYAWAFPSKSTSTTTYQQVLKRVFQDGSPKRLLTDRAPAFTSPKFRSFLLNRNIHPLITTSNNPQANGLCERLNATLTGKLRLLHLENPKVAWTKLVKKIVELPIYSRYAIIHDVCVTTESRIDSQMNLAMDEMNTPYNIGQNHRSNLLMDGSDGLEDTADTFLFTSESVGEGHPGPVGYKECPISKSTRVHSELSKSKGVHSELSKSAGVHSDLSKSTRLCSRVTVSNFEPTELQTQLSNPLQVSVHSLKEAMSPLVEMPSSPGCSKQIPIPIEEDSIESQNRVDNLPSYPMSPEQSYTLSLASVEDFKAQSGPKSPTSPTRGSESCRCSGDYTEPQMSQNSNFSCSSIEESEDNSSKSEENLSRSEDNSSKSEEIPRKSKKSRISKLTPQITSKQNQLLPSESSQPSTPEQPLASQSSEPLSSKKETSIIPKIKPPPYYRRKRQLPAERTSWDEPIESDIKSNWNKFQTQLSCLKEIKIPRYLNSSSSEIEELQLHGFCDASLNAYSAVFYLKTRFKIQKIKINLITSKTKVAPLKTITIPRLELSAALLLAQLNQVILESFPFQPDKTFLWTDSQICIDWIRSDASRWKAFVSNRVSSIQNLTQITDWFHVSSQDNPADCASRGIMPQDLVNHRIWWRCPIWLQENNVRYIPSSPTQVNLNIIQEEVGEGQVLDQTTLIQNSETMLNLEFIERYSTMTKLIRITAWCWRFYYNCLLFDPIRQKGPLTTRDLTKAIQVLVKSIQQVEFCTEIKLLKSNKQLPLSNKLTSLNPFLDTQGLLRVGGRLKYSYLNENQKFPLLQPKPPRQESLIKNLLTQNADIPKAIDENQEDSSILETTFIIEDKESNKDIGTPKIEISEVSVIDKSEGKYSKEPVVSVEALDKKELCHDDPAHLNVVEADFNRPKEATSGIINIYTEANESSSKEKVVPVEIVDTSTKDYLQSGEKAKLSRWKPIDSLCLEDVKESEDDNENYSSSAYIEWPEILKKEVLIPEALEKAVNLEDFEKAAESRQLSKEHLEESTEQGSCIKAESKTWEDPIESDLAAAESDNPAVPERELANESENLIQDSPQSDTQIWKLIPLPFKQ